ncbi:MAG: aldolase/citrate lyase family protein [Anaerotruncus sp.]|nr:aldolase/citrate lyase family protein [Anaerotruncus sp.]
MPSGRRRPPPSRSSTGASAGFLDAQKDLWREENVTETDGRLLYDLILKRGYTRASEIGTSTGHSGIWQAWALTKTGGSLITVEIEEFRHLLAAKNFKALRPRRGHRCPPGRRPQAHRGPAGAVRLHLRRRRQELGPQLFQGPPAQARAPAAVSRSTTSPASAICAASAISSNTSAASTPWRRRSRLRPAAGCPSASRRRPRLDPGPRRSWYSLVSPDEEAAMSDPDTRGTSAFFRERLLRGDRLVGTLLSLPSPELAEIASSAGFDWLFLDMEHGSLDPGDVVRMVQAARPPCALCRARPREPRDVGQEGPRHGRGRHHRPPRQQRRGGRPGGPLGRVSPEGGRSVGFSRANGYGARFQENVETANAETAVIAQVEHIDGVRAIGPILEVAGVDAVFIGPYDLSASLGKPGRIQDPDVREAIAAVMAAAARRKDRGRDTSPWTARLPSGPSRRATRSSARASISAFSPRRPRPIPGGVQPRNP